MKNLFEQIEHTKTKPHHVRKRIAFGVATGITTLIALVWLVGSFATGSFAIQGSTFAQNGSNSNELTTSAPSSDQGLAGAAAAISEAKQPAQIQIIDAASSTSKQKPQQTILPF